jgi:hypothetical protein
MSLRQREAICGTTASQRHTYGLLIRVASYWEKVGLGELNGGHGAGPAGVESKVDDHFFELVLGETVGFGQHKMAPQLLGDAAGDEGGHGYQAAVSFLTARSHTRRMAAGCRFSPRGWVARRSPG